MSGGAATARDLRTIPARPEGSGATTAVMMRAAELVGDRPAERKRTSLRSVLVVLWLAVAGTATAAGYRYYATPYDARPFAAGHDLFAPTGLVGHSLGLVGALFMAVGVGFYMARKRFRFMSGWGRLSIWLEVHIFLCMLGPYLVLLHTSFRIGGLVAIAFWSMSLVVASGVFGRFLYGHIPKTVHGQFRTLASVEQNRGEIEQMLRDAGVSISLVAGGSSGSSRPGLFTAVVDAVRFDLTKKRRERSMRLRLTKLKVPPKTRDRLVTLMLNEERIRHQISWLKPFQRLFRYWHVFHLPLALVMLLILAVHIGVAIAFGYGWPG